MEPPTTFRGTIPNSQAWPGRQEFWPGMTSFSARSMPNLSPHAAVSKMDTDTSSKKVIDEPSSLGAPYFQSNPYSRRLGEELNQRPVRKDTAVIEHGVHVT